MWLPRQIKSQDELVTDQDEDAPLTFEDFLEKFAPQLKNLTPEPGKTLL